MADDHKTSADSQAARVAEYRLRTLVRLSEWDLEEGPVRLMHAEWDWQTQIHYQDYMRDDLPDLLVTLAVDGNDGTVITGQYDDAGVVAQRSVPLPPGKRKAPPRAQIDAVRDALGWLVRREAHDTGCEDAR